MAILPPSPPPTVVRCVHDAPKHTCVQCAAAGAHHRARTSPARARTLAALLGDSAAADLFGAALNDAARVHGDRPKAALLPTNPKTTTPLGLAVGLSDQARNEKHTEAISKMVAACAPMLAAGMRGYREGQKYGTKDLVRHRDDLWTDSQMPPCRPVPNQALIDGVATRAADALADATDTPLGFDLAVPPAHGAVPGEATVHFGGPHFGVTDPVVVTGFRILGVSNLSGIDALIQQVEWRHERLIAGRPLPLDEPAFRHLQTDDGGPIVLTPDETLAITVQNLSNGMLHLRGVVYTRPWKAAASRRHPHREIF